MSATHHVCSEARGGGGLMARGDCIGDPASQTNRLAGYLHIMRLMLHRVQDPIFRSNYTADAGPSMTHFVSALSRTYPYRSPAVCPSIREIECNRVFVSCQRTSTYTTYRTQTHRHTPPADGSILHYLPVCCRGVCYLLSLRDLISTTAL
jgi:hypothetical protein